VSYGAELQEDGSLVLLEPERAVNRRIYRMFGSDRFLNVSFAPEVTKSGIETFLRVPLELGGRSYRFFWFKKENGIHAVLFAETGFGLDDVLVANVQERCIPKANNPELTLGKWVKRMKLNFSDTNVGCKLPPGCVSILDDFNETGVAEIDGAGLVSAEALNAIWRGYNKSKGQISEKSLCPYSGFQGRLAGYVKWQNCTIQ
jgi:RNA dependent RNA polymerase